MRYFIASHKAGVYGSLDSDGFSYYPVFGKDIEDLYFYVFYPFVDTDFWSKVVLYKKQKPVPLLLLSIQRWTVADVDNRVLSLDYCKKIQPRPIARILTDTGCQVVWDECIIIPNKLQSDYRHIGISYLRGFFGIRLKNRKLAYVGNTKRHRLSFGVLSALFDDRKHKAKVCEV